MTRRRGLIASALLLAGCGTSGSARRDLLPATLGTQWRRVSLSDLPPAALPPPLTSTTVKRGQSAKYEGSGNLDVALYEMSSSAAALDAVQRWRPEANTVFFYRDEFFVVVRYDGAADRQALNGFVRDMSAHLGPKK
jgi:hypothetical protein